MGGITPPSGGGAGAAPPVGGKAIPNRGIIEKNCKYSGENH